MEKEQSKSWWQTVPGILTGLTGVITAVTGLIAGTITLLNTLGLEFGERTAPAERKVQTKEEIIIPSESVNVSDAISLIENLYYLLSAKRFDEAISLYSPQLAERFSPDFFRKFKRVTIDDLQVTSRTENSINFRGQSTYVWSDGSTQRELRSYTVRNLDGELKITSSEFIKVTKKRR